MGNYSLKPATPVYSTRYSPAAVDDKPTGESFSTASTAEKSEGDASPDFRDLVTLMALGMSMNMSGSSEASLPGMGMNEVMAPLMLSLLEKLVAQQVETEPENDEAAGTQVAAQTTPKGMPIKGRLTQASHAGHVALDFGAPVGTPVKSTMDGKVVYAGWNNQGYGNLVIVENETYRTYYAHLSKIPVAVGERVRAGSLIGLSGNTGNSTGPHLHYEVRENGQAVNPAKYTNSY